ncbi:MAG: hypothetical protein R3195_12300 [Gemmatimonadota bacterium]|nr:hypothetical protein [Gemmatimonadota bacterium]
MLSRDDLLDLYRQHAGDLLLSVYIDADQHDPGERDAWRVRLKQGIAAERRKVEERADRSELAAFEAAEKRIRAALGLDDTGFLGGAGWVGFAGPDGLVHEERLPVRVPDLVRWENGLRIAPYLRALRQRRPVLVATVDQRRATIHRYLEGSLELVRTLHADTEVGDLTDIGTAKRATDHSGVRGKTGTDAAHRILEVAAERLVDRLISEIEELDDDSLLVIGGTPERVAALERSLPGPWRDRTTARPELHFGLGEAEVIAVTDGAASELTERLHGELLDGVVGQAAAAGNGRVGREGTEAALEARRVRTLLVSLGLTERDPDYADRLIGTAFGTNGADALVLTREPGERLDREGDGVAAALHY